MGEKQQAPKAKKGKVIDRGRNPSRGEPGAVSIASVAVSSKGHGFVFPRKTGKD